MPNDKTLTCTRMINNSEIDDEQRFIENQFLATTRVKIFETNISTNVIFVTTIFIAIYDFVKFATMLLMNIADSSDCSNANEKISSNYHEKRN